MDFTFGICVTKENKNLHPIILNQIKIQKIPNKQIIFIGDIYDDYAAIEDDMNARNSTSRRNNHTHVPQGPLPERSRSERIRRQAGDSA